METIEIRDWAQLPPELLETIAARVAEIVDRVCFSSVCPQWRSASKSVAHNLPPQLPWLLLPKKTEDTGIVTTFRCFFSLSRNRVFAVPLPEPSHRMFPSPSGRIVVPQGIETLALLNPLTLSSLTLPPLPLTESRRSNGGAFALQNAKVFASNVVAVGFPDCKDLHFCRPGDSSWKSLDWASYSDFAYHKDKIFFVNDSTSNIGVFDVDTLQMISVVPPFSFRELRIYLVESFAGDLLRVERMTSGTRGFRVYLLDEGKEKMDWMRINSIGDNVLFVDGVQAMSFEATESNGWRRNCIYFVDDLTRPSRKGVMVFSIGDGVIEELPLFSYTCFGYWGNALWVVPTLC